MSRSRKKRPGGGITTAPSDKSFKVAEHRRERRHVTACLRQDAEVAPAVYGNPWKAPKDGKQYWTDYDARWMRK